MLPWLVTPLASCCNVCVFIWSDPVFLSTQAVANPVPSPDLCHNVSFFSEFLLVIQPCLVSPVSKVCMGFVFGGFFFLF